jgi:Ca2+-dependent lipid-binding protein
VLSSLALVVSEWLQGTSDPYCIVSVIGAKGGNKIRTKTVYKSLSPTWAEKYELYASVC